jgi:hypothetical protein
VGLRIDETLARALRTGLITYVASRVLVLLGVGLVAIARTQEAARDGLDRVATRHHIRDVLSAWDGFWNIEIIRLGYPSNVPADITYFQPEARAAFFPVFPAIARVVDVVVPGGPATAAILLNLVLGAVAIAMIGLVAHAIADAEVAATAMVLAALFPGSFVLSMVYSEATMITLAGITLVALVRRHWWLAAVAGVLTTATRPNGLGVVLAGLATVWILRHDRSARWRAAAATAVMPLGFVGAIAWIGSRAGEGTVWFRVQREAWDEGFSFGLSTVRFIAEWAVAPLGSPTRALTAASVAVIVIGAVAARRVRLDPAVGAYTFGVVVLMLTPATVTARPRFVFAAFGLLIAVAMWWVRNGPSDPARRRSVELVVIGASSAGLVAVTGIYGLLGAIP